MHRRTWQSRDAWAWAACACVRGATHAAPKAAALQLDSKTAKPDVCCLLLHANAGACCCTGYTSRVCGRTHQLLHPHPKAECSTHQQSEAWRAIHQKCRQRYCCFCTFGSFNSVAGAWPAVRGASVSTSGARTPPALLHRHVHLRVEKGEPCLTMDCCVNHGTCIVLLASAHHCKHDEMAAMCASARLCLLHNPGIHRMPRICRTGV